LGRPRVKKKKKKKRAEIQRRLKSPAHPHGGGGCTSKKVNKKGPWQMWQCHPRHDFGGGSTRFGFTLLRTCLVESPEEMVAGLKDGIHGRGKPARGGGAKHGIKRTTTPKKAVASCTREGGGRGEKGQRERLAIRGGRVCQKDQVGG